MKQTKTPYSPELGKAKQLLYSKAYNRVDQAIKKGSHIEAISILESLMSDRLESALSAFTKEPIHVSTLGTLFRKLDSLVPANASLVEMLWEWNAARGLVIHQMVKLTNEHNSTWTERIAFARKTAKEGKLLLRELRKYTDPIIKTHKAPNRTSD